MLRREMTYDDVARVCDHLQGIYGFRIHDRRTSETMSVVGAVLQSLGVMSQKEFIGGYCTTLLDQMYLDFVPGVADSYAPCDQLALLVHETTHVAQYRADGLGFLGRYLISTTERAKIETEAYAAASTIQWTCTGQVITGDFVFDALGSYSCPQAQREMARVSMNSNNAVIAAGGQVGSVAQEAIRFMRSRVGL